MATAEPQEGSENGFPESETTSEQWAVRYVDGDIDIYMTRERAALEVKYAAAQVVAKRREDWEAYEGAELVKRTVTTTASEWTVATVPNDHRSN